MVTSSLSASASAMDATKALTAALAARFTNIRLAGHALDGLRLLYSLSLLLLRAMAGIADDPLPPCSVAIGSPLLIRLMLDP